MPTGLLPTLERTRKVTQVRGLLRSAAPALGIYAAVRLTCLLVVTAGAWSVGRHPRSRLGAHWDALWYERVAHSGYDVMTLPDTGGGVSNLAFFPLYPFLERAVVTVLPIGLVNAGLLVAWVSAGLACLGIYAVGARLHDRRVALVLVVLWGVLPNAVVQTMAYSESLLTALAAWSLYAALTRRWLWAAFLALLAGLARPNGIAVAAAVACAAAVELWREPRRRLDPRLWAAPVIAPLGWAAYVGWVGVRTGSALGYFAVQRKWGSRFDFGHYTLDHMKGLALHAEWLFQYGSAIILGAGLLGLLLLILDRPPVVLLVYTVVLVVIACGGTHYFGSRPRFLLPAFPLLLPPALALARARPRTRGVVTGALAALSVAYGAYLVILAPSSP